jgi:hypothetical protein
MHYLKKINAIYYQTELIKMDLWKKIQAYRAKHIKPKEFTLMGWIHNGIQMIMGAAGAEICAAHAVSIDTFSSMHGLNSLNNPWYWYFSFGFVAVLTISFFSLWDIYVFGNRMNQMMRECDKNVL